jgi:hypothetical protein
MRNEMALQIRRHDRALWERAAPSIPHWLPMAVRRLAAPRVRGSEPVQAEGRGRSNSTWCCSTTATAPTRPRPLRRDEPVRSRGAFRSAQGRIRAAGALKRGLEVLTGPVMHLQRIRRSEAERIETELAGRSPRRASGQGRALAGRALDSARPAV